MELVPRKIIRKTLDGIRRKRRVCIVNNTYEILESAKLIRETEKAALISVKFGDEYRRDVWFPKTAIRIEGDKIAAASWVIDAKTREHGGFNASHIATVAAPAVPAAKPARRSKSAAKW